MPFTYWRHWRLTAAQTFIALETMIAGEGTMSNHHQPHRQVGERTHILRLIFNGLPIGVTALAVIAVLLALPLVAHAQQGWSPAVNVWPDHYDAPSVAVDHLGNVFAVIGNAPPNPPVAHARRYSATASSWGAPVELSALDISGDGPCPLPGGPVTVNGRIILDAGGNAMVVVGGGGGEPARTLIACYSVAGDVWTAREIARPLLRGRIFADPTGGLFFLWVEYARVGPGSLYSSTVHAARLSLERGALTEWTLSDTVAGAFGDADMAVDAGGNAYVVWTESTGIKTSVYSAAAGVWSAPVWVFTGPNYTYTDMLHVASDALGNVTAIWAVYLWKDSFVVASRYDRTSRTWGPPSSLGPGAYPAIAVAPDGSALAIWTRLDGQYTRIVASFRDGKASGWSGGAEVSPAGITAKNPMAVSDGLGNLTAIWLHESRPTYVVRTARRAITGAVTTRDLATLNDEPDLTIAAGAGGHVAATWSRYGTPGSLRVAQWQPKPAAPAIASIAAGEHALWTTVVPPVTTEPFFAPVYYEYSTDDGETWTTRFPRSTASPIRIGDLTTGVPYPVRVRAVNSAGTGAPSAAVVGTPVFAPAAPTNLKVIAQSGARVTLQWTPGGGVSATGYVLQGGVQPGAVHMNNAVASGLPTYTFDAFSGGWYFRVHAIAGSAWSEPSNEIQISVDPTLRPSGPVNLLGSVSGSTVTLSWINTFLGGAPTGLVLEVEQWGGRGAGSADHPALRIPLPVTDHYRLSGVPSGTYFVLLRAVNDAGQSFTGAGLVVSVPETCGSQSVPRAPEHLTASVSGRAFYVAWEPPSAGAAIETYMMQVTGAYTGTFTTASRAFGGSAGPGSYTVAVRGINSCGIGVAAAPVTVVIPSGR